MQGFFASKFHLRACSGSLDRICATGSSRDEIDVAALRICADQLHAELISHVHVLSVDQQAFHVRINYAYECAVGLVLPVTMASNIWPILLVIFTAAIRLLMPRSTFRAASSFAVQLVAIA